MLKLFCVSALLAVGTAAAAQTDQAPTPPIKNADKRVCRSEVPTGSMMAGKRVCHTKSEWAAIDLGNAYKVDHWRDNGSRGSLDRGGGFRPGS